MSLIISVIFTILGGLVAGGVGYFATIVSLRERRKERHLEEHKNNLKVVSKALDQVFSDVWIFVYGADNLKLPRAPFGNEKWVAKVEIRKEPIAMDLPNPFSDDHHTIQVGINTALYEDIQNHFPALYKLLQYAEKAVKENGTKILKLLNSLSSTIYEKLENSHIDFPSSDGNNTILKKFNDIKNEMIETDYAGSVFLLVLGEDEDGWPNKVGWLKYNHLYDSLKELAEEIVRKFGDDLNQLRSLHDGTLRKIDDAKEEIERIELTTRLNGRCRYL